MTTTPASAALHRSLWSVVGFLVAVEVVSGVLQGFYTPIFSDVARHLGIRDADVNWFEAAQLVVSALAVPLLARLGDLWGHRNVLLLSTAVTAVGSWTLALAPGFSTFLVGWALQGAYVVWLPVEVAIIHRRTAGAADQHRTTRRAAAFLVAALETGVVVGALTSGALVDSTSMKVLLCLPAAAVTASLLVVWWGVERDRGQASGGYDYAGLAWLTATLGLLMGGLIAIRLLGVGSVLPWVLVLLSAAALAGLVRFERALGDRPDGAVAPLVDVRTFVLPAQWPVQLTAFLFGMSVLGAQIPLSTFARTDPSTAGFGLGASAAFVSTLIGVYVVTMVVGALLLPVLSSRLGPRGAMVAGCALVGVGYGLFLPLHDTTTQTLTNMGVAGVGSGLLVAALPAAAAAAAPAHATGFATGMTNATKTVGGAIASAVFAIALASTGSIDDPALGHAPLSGYLTVWAVCSASALVAAGVLLATRRESSESPRFGTS